MCSFAWRKRSARACQCASATRSDAYGRMPNRSRPRARTARRSSGCSRTGRGRPSALAVSTPTEPRLAQLSAEEDGPVYEVVALRYGTCVTRRAQCFLGYEVYGEDDAPQKMDFFLWVVRNADTTIVVDTGFDPQVAERRARTCLIPPADALALAGVPPADVEHVVL